MRATIFKKIVSVLLLVLIAGASLGCVNIGQQPEKKRGSEVKIGGDKGVVVDHPGGDADKDKR